MTQEAVADDIALVQRFYNAHGSRTAIEEVMSQQIV